MSGVSTRRECGFTLIEMTIAMALLAILLVAALPMLVGSIRSTLTVKLVSQAKNLSQQRIDQMRDLKYHVDRQNGPYLDLLDIYYSNVSSTATSLMVDGASLSGKFVSSGSMGAGEPSGPYYRVSIASLPGNIVFSQVIASQFLTSSGAVMAASTFSTYDSQTVGKDQPPSLFLGVTVVTSWTEAGKTHSYSVYTRFADGEAPDPLISTSASATVADISSSVPDGSSLRLRAAVVSLNGSLSTGSSVNGQVAAAIANHTGDAPVNGTSTLLVAPGASTSTTASSGGSCSTPWYGFNGAATSNTTADVSAGVPRAPQNAGTTSPFNAASAQLGGSGLSGCALAFSNMAGGSVAALPIISSGAPYFGAGPYVDVPDVAGQSVTASAYVTSSTSTNSYSGSSVFMGSPIRIFPYSTLSSAGSGLVAVKVTSASLACASGTSSATASYQVVISWRGSLTPGGTINSYSAAYSYTSPGTTVNLVGGTAWNPSVYYLDASGTRLSDAITSLSLATLATGATSGLSGFTSGVVSLTTARTQANEAGTGYSAITVKVAPMTCLAADTR